MQDGSRKTLGIMLPGEYKFDTDEKKLMEIISGIPVEKMPKERLAIAIIIMCVMLAGYVGYQIKIA